MNKTSRKRTSHLRYATVLTAALLAAPRAEASLLAYEGFNYAAGSSAAGQGTNAGWPTTGQNWTGPSSATMEVPGSDYSYHNLAHSGNVVDVPANTTGITRTFGTKYDMSEHDYWFSMVIDVDSAVGSAYAGLSLLLSTAPANSQKKFFIGQDNQHTTWSMELLGNSSQAASSTPITPQKSVYLALELNGNQGRANLYVEPNSISGTQPVTPSAFLNIPEDLQFSFNEISIQSGGTQVMDLDEFRFGTSYADVTPLVAPEPSSWLLLCLGLIASIGLHEFGIGRSSRLLLNVTCQRLHCNVARQHRIGAEQSSWPRQI